jgi:hypothetical protein
VLPAVSGDREMRGWGTYLPHIHYGDSPHIVVVAFCRSHVAVEDLGWLVVTWWALALVGCWLLLLLPVIIQSFVLYFDRLGLWEVGVVGKNNVIT